MADAADLAMLKKGVAEWNAWQAATNHSDTDLSAADLSGMKLNDIDLLRTNLAGANLTRTQLERAHLKNANLTGATLRRANLEGANARDAIFDGVLAGDANFEVSTLRGARFRKAELAGVRFHRAYLRDADLSGAVATNAWLRFARLDGASCQEADFTGADLRHASLVKTDLRGANLTDVHVFGVSAWSVETDAETRQDLIVGIDQDAGDTPLRAHDLHTAQLLALMLDGAGIRRVFDSVSSKLVLILGSFSKDEKPVLDALRRALQGRGYVAVTFDFERPANRDYAETVVSLVGMSRFVVADFTNAKEVRAEVAQARSQFKRVPIIPIAKQGEQLPVTMVNVFSAEELRLVVKYTSVDDLLGRLQTKIIEVAEARAKAIAEALAQAEAILRGERDTGEARAP